MANEEETVAEEIEILAPDQAVTIAGERVVVREFRYVEGMRLAAKIEPLLERLRALMESDEEPDDQQVYDRLVNADPDAMIDLMAQACDHPREWVEALGDEDGMFLANAFWRANRGFFVRRLMLTSPGLRAAVAAGNGVRGAGSVSPSSLN